jgi:hypothetical protein
MFLLLILLHLPSPPWQFAVIGDTQENWHVARKAAAQMHAARVDFVVHLGDVWNCASLRRWMMTRKMFAGLRPVFVIGNHELRQCGSRRHRPRRYRRLWMRSFGRARTTTSFVWKGVEFFAIDSATPDVSGSQLMIVDTVLSYVRGPVVLLSHRALPSASLQRARWFRDMDPMPMRWRNAKLHGFLQSQRHRILGAFHGHWHGYREYVSDGIPTWASGGGGGPLAPGHTYHWLLVTVFDAPLWIALHVEKKEIR